MPIASDLSELLLHPSESLSLEYKSWLDLSDKSDRARLAKAAIALANHGGGTVVLGMRELNDDTGGIISQVRPGNIPRYSGDDVNAAINRFADPPFHSELQFAIHPQSANEHAIVQVPSGSSVPIMSKKGCEGIISPQRCYIRKPGPKSEEPHTSEEWRAVLNRCVRDGRESMLDAIRSIVQGQGGTPPPSPVLDLLTDFTERSQERWRELIESLPPNAPGRMPFGRYELSAVITDLPPSLSLTDLKRRMENASTVKHTSWGTFLMLNRGSYAPRIHNGKIEAWFGAERHPYDNSPAHANFWQADTSGHFYLIRGFDEDGNDQIDPGKYFDVTLPIWRIGEAMLFIARLATELGHDPTISFQCKYVGLRGRILIRLDGKGFVPPPTRVSSSDAITLSTQVRAFQIRDNLSEVLRSFLAPLYELFDFFELPPPLVTNELKNLTSNHF
jgi:Putative DNA-binding domain